MSWPVFRRSLDPTDCAKTRPAISSSRSGPETQSHANRLRNLVGEPLAGPHCAHPGRPRAGAETCCLDPDHGNVVDCIAYCHTPCRLVHDDHGRQTGCKKITADKGHATDAFPGMIPDAGRVVRAGDGKVGFHASHRMRAIGTSTGLSRYAPPADAGISILVIADDSHGHERRDGTPTVMLQTPNAAANGIMPGRAAVTSRPNACQKNHAPYR